MFNIKGIARSTDFIEKLFSGGTDNGPVTKEELKNYKAQLNLTKKMDDKEMNGAWTQAMLVAKKRLTWRIRHSHDLSIDRYKVRAASFLVISAVILIAFAPALPAPFPLLYPILSVVFIIAACTILLSRNKLWEDYSSSIQ